MPRRRARTQAAGPAVDVDRLVDRLLEPLLAAHPTPTASLVLELSSPSLGQTEVKLSTRNLEKRLFGQDTCESQRSKQMVRINLFAKYVCI